MLEGGCVGVCVREGVLGMCVVAAVLRVSTYSLLHSV